jgi:hypothetical protein
MQNGALVVTSILKMISKTSPYSKNLTKEQAAILVNAGDNQELMIAPSAYPDSYSDNKVLYKKIVLNTVEVFEYSNDPRKSCSMFDLA